MQFYFEKKGPTCGIRPTRCAIPVADDGVLAIDEGSGCAIGGNHGTRVVFDGPYYFPRFLIRRIDLKDNGNYFSSRRGEAR